jgi:hypothetical protein
MKKMRLPGVVTPAADATETTTTGTTTANSQLAHPHAHSDIIALWPARTSGSPCTFLHAAELLEQFIPPDDSLLSAPLEAIGAVK